MHDIYRRNRQILIDRAWLNEDNCVICGKPFESKQSITAAHIRAVADGGDHSLSNLAPVHMICNCTRHSLTMATP